MPTINLIELYNDPEVRSISKFYQRAKEIEISDLCRGYAELRQNAPRRSDNNKPYFHNRTGVSSNLKPSNRREEHLALALYNASRDNTSFSLPDERSFEFIDYQTPLKSRRSDKGIGKVDLLGVIDKTVPAVIELKIEGLKGTLADTPLHALMEGLAYCAIFEANSQVIAAEASSKLNHGFRAITPSLIILAPEEYWNRYLQRPRAGNWLPVLNEIIEGLRHELKIETHLIALRDLNFEMGHAECPAKLIGACELISVNEIL